MVSFLLEQKEGVEDDEPPSSIKENISNPPMYLEEYVRREELSDSYQSQLSAKSPTSLELFVSMSIGPDNAHYFPIILNEAAEEEYVYHFKADPASYESDSSSEEETVERDYATNFIKNYALELLPEITTDATELSLEDGDDCTRREYHYLRELQNVMFGSEIQHYWNQIQNKI